MMNSPKLRTQWSDDEKGNGQRDESKIGRLELECSHLRTRVLILENFALDIEKSWEQKAREALKKEIVEIQWANIIAGEATALARKINEAAIDYANAAEQAKVKAKKRPRARKRKSRQR